jgi:molybdopterin converting factor small subunit
MNSHTVLLFGPLRDKFNSGKLTIEMPENSSIDDLLSHLGVASDFVKTAMNGEIVPISTQLEAGSEIALLPPVSGG